MFSTASLTGIALLYMALLFALAIFVERKVRKQSGLSFQGPIYALSLAVFFTSWTFYGSVGFALENGLQFFAIYIGAILGLFFGAKAIKKMVLAKESFRLTSIADFISTRYRRSQRIAALVTIIAILGLLPYIVLQLRAINSAFDVLTNDSATQGSWSAVIITLTLAFITILFGARKLDPTERHQGIIAVLAAECLVKLFAFIALGLFVTFGLFDGFGDLFKQAEQANLQPIYSVGGSDSVLTWVALIILGAAAVLMLPRQFHVTVVENPSTAHIKSALTLFPIYTLGINLFVIPIALAGLLLGLPKSSGDQFVLLIPKLANSEVMALVGYIGGFAAATGMVIVTLITLATMTSNHLVIPVWRRFKPDLNLGASLLHLRWILILGIALIAHLFANQLDAPYLLVALGLISFSAVLQLAPAGLIGLFWRKGNSLGAALGLISGFILWGFTLVMPPMVGEGWIDDSVMTEGLFGHQWLRPNALFGLEFLSPLAHGVFWSLFFNITLYVVGSKLYKPRKVERAQTEELFNATNEVLTDRYRNARPTGLEAYIEREPKTQEAELLLNRFLSNDAADQVLGSILTDLQLGARTHFTIVELMEFHRLLEQRLAGSIGAAGAHSAIEESIRYSDRESADLKALFSHIASELKLSSSATENSPQFESLQDNNEQLNNELAKLKNANKVLEEKVDRQYEVIHGHRLEIQKLTHENQTLKARLGLSTDDS